MCFKIKEDTPKITKRLKARKKTITVYKCVASKKPPEEGCCYMSPHKQYEWSKGLNKSDRTRIIITKKEKDDKEIHKGFHFYRDFEYANWRASHVWLVAECKIDPEKVVAANGTELVAKEATFVRILNKKDYSSQDVEKMLEKAFKHA